MLPSSSKNKGRAGQKLARDIILKYFPNLHTDDVRSTSMGQGGEDLQLSSAARVVLPYQAEVKNKATSQLHTYYAQAKTHGAYEPIVLVKKDRDIMLAAVSAEHFFSILMELGELRKLITKEN